MKNKAFQLYVWAAFVFMIAAILAGCWDSNNSFIENEVNPKINILGIKLNMAEAKVHESAGSKGEKAMCIYGYEYAYADKHINIGFKSDNSTVRRITIKNPDTSIYGIKPGTELAEVYAVIEANNFTKDSKSKYKYYKNNIILSIISINGTKADGVTIEINPD